jgi:hypothetical protein
METNVWLLEHNKEYFFPKRDQEFLYQIRHYKILKQKYEYLIFNHSFIKMTKLPLMYIFKIMLTAFKI